MLTLRALLFILALAHTDMQHARKRRRVDAPDPHDREDDADKAAMLKELEHHLSLQLGVEPVVGIESDSESEKDDWDGIASSEEDNDALDERERPPIGIISYEELVAGGDPAAFKSSKAVYKAFMASSVSKQISDSSSTSKSKTKNSDQDEDSAEMRNLDATLQNLISTLPTSNSFSQQKAPNYTIQKNTPLPLRKALTNTRVQRAKKQAEIDRLAGVVKSRPISERDNTPALTKKERRLRNGEEDHRRRHAAGLGGAVGRLKGKGASVLQLNRYEIERGMRGLVGEARKTNGKHKMRKPTKSKSRK